MKKLLTLLAFIITLSASAQVDTIIYNAPHPGSDTLIAYRIDTTVTGGSSDSNMVWVSYHYISGQDSIYQSQFIVYDSLNKSILPNVDLINNGWRSNGTSKWIKLNSTQIGWTPEQLRDSLILPDLKVIYGNSNVTKL